MYVSYVKWERVAISISITSFAILFHRIEEAWNRNYQLSTLHVSTYVIVLGLAMAIFTTIVAGVLVRYSCLCKLVCLAWNSHANLLLVVCSKRPRQDLGLCRFSFPSFRKRDSPKFVEICIQTPCWCPSKGFQHGGRKATETSVVKFSHWNEKL